MKHFPQRLNGLLLVIALLALGFATFGFAPSAYAASADSQPSNGTTHASPNFNYCDPGWVFDDITRFPDEHFAIGPAQGDSNGTDFNATATLTATASGTFTVTEKFGVEVQAGVIVAGIKANFDVSVSTSVTASIGNTVQVIIPPHSSITAQYGIFTAVTRGHYYYINDHCNVTADQGYITTSSPFKVGWLTWNS